MKINGIDFNEVIELENKYDNLQLLDIVRYLLGVVINDIDFMNDNLIDDKDEYDLGNNYIIKNEDLECIVSILDNISNIQNYNK